MSSVSSVSCAPQDPIGISSLVTQFEIFFDFPVVYMYLLKSMMLCLYSHTSYIYQFKRKQRTNVKRRQKTLERLRYHLFQCSNGKSKHINDDFCMIFC